MTDEERRFTRIPFKVFTELKTKDAVYKTSYLENLSVGGCLMPVKSDLVPGTDCKILINLEGGGETVVISIKGRIVRVDSRTIAVKFTLIDPDSLFHLQNIIRYNAQDSDKIDDEFSKHPGLI